MSLSKLSLEDLSNEIFLEIFDYLYGQNIFYSFFELNHRFKTLCISYSTLHIDAQNTILSQNMLDILYLIPSKHIQSLKLWNNFEDLFPAISYFSSLHSLTIACRRNTYMVKRILEKLPEPNHLYSLSINNAYSEYGLPNPNGLFSKLHNLRRLELDLRSKRPNCFTINQYLLSLRYLRINCGNVNDFFKSVPFIPNLISLNLTYTCLGDRQNYISGQRNSLSKLKRLQLTYVYENHIIDYVLPLCPQLKILQVNCEAGIFERTNISAKDYEQILSPMKFLQKIEFNIFNDSLQLALELLEEE